MDLCWEMSGMEESIPPMRPCNLFWFWNRSYSISSRTILYSLPIPRTESSFHICTYNQENLIHPSPPHHTPIDLRYAVVTYKTPATPFQTDNIILNQHGALAHLDEWQILHFTQATHVSLYQRLRQVEEGVGSVANVAEKHLIEIHGHKYQSPLQRVERRKAGGRVRKRHSIFPPCAKHGSIKAGQVGRSEKNLCRFMCIIIILHVEEQPQNPFTGLFRHRARPRSRKGMGKGEGDADGWQIKSPSKHATPHRSPCPGVHNLYTGLVGKAYLPLFHRR